MTRTALVAGLAVLVLALFILGQLFPRGRKPYSTDLGALRARFNDDTGKVRLLLLLSPT
jgi:hypothetical protein